ncbi:MAG TPA: acireductone synthase [Stellaceae bacterium]|nr:acireductone synthase [Stellaceae bacterium]
MIGGGLIGRGMIGKGMIKAVVTDIEGTTTPIDFVARTLFPYARAHLADFLRAHADDPEVARQLAATRDLAGDPTLDRAGVITTLIGWIDEDRKATPLKALQGMIWARGYETGAFQAEVYDDVPGALKAWADQGLRLFCYSSGSVAAQKLLFAHTGHGDLTPLFEGYFDTVLGPKLEAASYAKLAAEIGLMPDEILFLSDLPGELAAAAASGLHTARLDRECCGQGCADFHEISQGYFR